MAKYPVLRVGQRFTADLASSMLPDYAYKTGTTARTSTTTLASDPDLQLPVAADALYEMKLSVQFTGPDTADVNIGWTGPAGCGMQWDIQTLGTGAAGYATDISGAYALGSTLVCGLLNSTAAPIVCTGFVDTAGTAGTLAFRWAQGVSNASAVTALAASFLRLRRVA